MSILRYTASLDNTITNAFEENLTTRGTGSNMGLADTLEVFSIGSLNSTTLHITILYRVLLIFKSPPFLPHGKRELVWTWKNIQI